MSKKVPQIFSRTYDRLRHVLGGLPNFPARPYALLACSTVPHPDACFPLSLRPYVRILVSVLAFLSVARLALLLLHFLWFLGFFSQSPAIIDCFLWGFLGSSSVRFGLVQYCLVWFSWVRIGFDSVSLAVLDFCLARTLRTLFGSLIAIDPPLFRLPRLVIVG